MPTRESGRGRPPDNREAELERLNKYLADAKALETERGMLGAINFVLKDLRINQKEWDLWYARLHATWTKEKKANLGAPPDERLKQERLKAISEVNKQAMIEDAKRLRSEDPPGTSSDDITEE